MPKSHQASSKRYCAEFRCASGATLYNSFLSVGLSMMFMGSVGYIAIDEWRSSETPVIKTSFHIPAVVGGWSTRQVFKVDWERDKVDVVFPVTMMDWLFITLDFKTRTGSYRDMSEVTRNWGAPWRVKMVTFDFDDPKYSEIVKRATAYMKQVKAAHKARAVKVPSSSLEI